MEGVLLLGLYRPRNGEECVGRHSGPCYLEHVVPPRKAALRGAAGSSRTTAAFRCIRDGKIVLIFLRPRPHAANFQNSFPSRVLPRNMQHLNAGLAPLLSTRSL